MTNEFFSSFAIGEAVEFRPMKRHQNSLGITDEFLEGTIMAVRFTEAKVFYDVYNNYWGVLFDGVDSCKVKEVKLLTV